MAKKNIGTYLYISKSIFLLAFIYFIFVVSNFRSHVKALLND